MNPTLSRCLHASIGGKAYRQTHAPAPDDQTICFTRPFHHERCLSAATMRWQLTVFAEDTELVPWIWNGCNIMSPLPEITQLILASGGKHWLIHVEGFVDAVGVMEIKPLPDMPCTMDRGSCSCRRDTYSPCRSCRHAHHAVIHSGHRTVAMVSSAPAMPIGRASIIDLRCAASARTVTPGERYQQLAGRNSSRRLDAVPAVVKGAIAMPSGSPAVTRSKVYRRWCPPAPKRSPSRP